jgi:hypothetical protein
MFDKPEWKDAPNYAEYLAQNYDGSWYWYSRKPINRNQKWEKQISSHESSEPSIKIKDWKNTIESRPNEFKIIDNCW